MRRMTGKGATLATVLVLALACAATGQELLDSTYAKYFPLGSGLSCRMDQFVENHGTVGYRGMVKNESSTAYLDVVLIVGAYDASGELLGAMDLAIGRLPANDVARFESMLEANYYKFDKFSVHLKKVVPEDGN